MHFEEFRSLVEHCRNEAMSNMADIRDAYKRFYRPRALLSRRQSGHCQCHRSSRLRTVFRENKFIESAGRVRGVSEHVVTGDVELLDSDNVRFTLTPKSSAAALFAAPCARLTDKQRRNPTHQPLRWLAGAEDFIARAIAKAREA